MPITRSKVQQFADEHGIELEITEFQLRYANHGRPGINHVHAYTKTGERFSNFGLHNMSIWDEDCATKIDWGYVLAELEDHLPEPCPDLLANGGCGCEVCDEDFGDDGRFIESLWESENT